MVKIKVCGMKEPQNIKDLANLKPDYMGFIFYPASSRFANDLDLEIIKSLPHSINKTGVFVNSSKEDILITVNKYKLNTIQLHGDESPEFCSELKHTGIKLIKAFGIDNILNLNILYEYIEVIDYFIFDTKTSKYGGSGQRFDWGVLNSYNLNKPYFLSGGISLEDLNEIKNLDQPWLYAIDLNSRFEIRPGLKDIEKLKTFFTEFKKLA